MKFCFVLIIEIWLLMKVDWISRNVLEDRVFRGAFLLLWAVFKPNIQQKVNGNVMFNASEALIKKS